MNKISEKQRRFIIKQLLPYFENRELISMTGAMCKYFAEDGRKCVFGKNILRSKYNPKMEGKRADVVLKEWGQVVLKKEARDINLHSSIWNGMQNIHDQLASLEQKDVVLNRIKILEDLCKCKFPQLCEAL
jgi:hypothetical protein